MDSMTDNNATDEDETVTVVSYNRPLTRSARRALEPLGIVDEEAAQERGRWTVVEVEERPDADTLEAHELRVEEDPTDVYRTDRGNTVEVYPDMVLVDGNEQALSPEEAREHADANGWEEVGA